MSMFMFFIMIEIRLWRLEGEFEGGVERDGEVV